MAQITAATVAQLRERTGLGMMECKKALTETDGDVEAAVDFLRKKGVKDRGDRVAGEGIVMSHVSADGRTGVLVELNAETDFVARNDDFKGLVRQLVTKLAELPHGEVPATKDAFLSLSLEDGTVADAIKTAVQRIGEKIELGRFARFDAPEGNVVVAYIHSTTGSGADGGRRGVLVETTGADTTLGKEVAMHISFSKPQFLNEAEVPAEILEKEREIAMAQAENDPKMAGKPANIIESMVTGRVRKELEARVLLKQPYIREPSKSIENLAKEAGAQVVRFARFEVGENVPKKEDASA